MRRSGGLRTWQVDRDCPYQAALPNKRVAAEFKDIEAVCAGLSLAPWKPGFVGPQGYMDTFCFSDPEHARLFIERFGAEPIDPKTRPRWSNKPPRRKSR